MPALCIVATPLAAAMAGIMAAFYYGNMSFGTGLIFGLKILFITAVGGYNSQPYQYTLETPRNKKLVQAFRAKYRRDPGAPAAFTYTTGQAHWELLLRARAVENQCHVLASAQGGLHENGRRTWGHTLAIDPWGQVLAQQPEGASVVMAELDWQRLQDVRLQLPALQHRVF